MQKSQTSQNVDKWNQNYLHGSMPPGVREKTAKLFKATLWTGLGLRFIPVVCVSCDAWHVSLSFGLFLHLRLWRPFSTLSGETFSQQLKWKMPLTSTSETNALFWLLHDKSCSPSKLLLPLFKSSIIAQLSAAQRRIGWVHTDLRNPSPSGLWLMVPCGRWLFLYFYLIPFVVEAQSE